MAITLDLLFPYNRSSHAQSGQSYPPDGADGSNNQNEEKLPNENFSVKLSIAEKSCTDLEIKLWKFRLYQYKDASGQEIEKGVELKFDLGENIEIWDTKVGNIKVGANVASLSADEPLKGSLLTKLSWEHSDLNLFDILSLDYSIKAGYMCLPNLLLNNMGDIPSNYLAWSIKGNLQLLPQKITNSTEISGALKFKRGLIVYDDLLCSASSPASLAPLNRDRNSFYGAVNVEQRVVGPLKMNASYDLGINNWGFDLLWGVTHLQHGASFNLFLENNDLNGKINLYLPLRRYREDAQDAKIKAGLNYNFSDKWLVDFVGVDNLSNQALENLYLSLSYQGPVFSLFEAKFNTSLTVYANYNSLNKNSFGLSLTLGEISNKPNYIEREYDSYPFSYANRAGTPNYSATLRVVDVIVDTSGIEDFDALVSVLDTPEKVLSYCGNFTALQHAGLYTPQKTYKNQSGMCRDIAWFQAYCLSRNGYESLVLSFAPASVVGSFRDYWGEGHAYCIYKNKESGKWSVLPTGGKIITDTNSESPEDLANSLLQTKANAVVYQFSNPVRGRMISSNISDSAKHILDWFNN